MSASRRSIALSVLVLCAFALIFPAAPVHAQPPEAPINLQVMPMGLDTLQLYWEPAPCCAEPVEFLVYRNGDLLTLPGQEIPGVPGQPFYTYDDIGLAPATPHTYTVQARNTVTWETSPMSERVAWMTDVGTVIRVPQEVPTIYDAVMAATPGTTIYITPGIYLEMQPLDLGMMGKSGITIKGQDPEGVVLEMIAGMGDVNLDPSPGTNNTLSGVTLSGGSVIMGPGDTVTNCVFLGGPMNAVSGGGFVTNSVFDLSMGIDVPGGESMLVANSIFLNGDGIWFQNPDNVYLLNNNFNYGFNWSQLPGEGNYDDVSCFEPESPPDPFDPFWYPSYIPCLQGPDQDAGAFVGFFVYDTMPDVGAFEVDEPYSPRPPKDLTVVMEQTQPGYTLQWTASPDDPFVPFPPPVPSTNPVDWYLISRSDNPDMVNPAEFIVPAGETTFADTDYFTYPSYYQVRAIGQFSQMPPMPPLDFDIVSMPANTVTTDEPYLRLNTVSPSTVEFYIDFYPYYPWPGMVYFNVYRNGQLLTPSPIPEFTSYTDTNLAPNTPHLYTAQAVMECLTPPDCYYPPGGLTSMMSMPFGAKTDTATLLRVPQDFPTIQAAVAAASPGTTIHVGPGLYEEEIDLSWQSQISIVGQDAQGVVLDLSATPSQAVDLDSAPGTANTISGFTILGGTVLMGEGDTVSGCVFRDSPSASVQGGGFVTNSVFDGVYGAAPWSSPPVVVDPDMFMQVANSVFLTDGVPPFMFMEPTDLYLRNNAFDYGYFIDPFIPGEGNFEDPWPGFMAPGPPQTYVIEAGPSIDAGADVGLPFFGFAPDVGALELGLPFTPEPPENLTATWNSMSWSIDLSWQPPPSPQPITEYLIHRSESPDFPPPDDSPIMAVPAGQLFFQDFTVDRGTTYYYQVKANSGGTVPPEEGVLSLPSNTASATANLPPTADDDAFSTMQETPVLIPAPGILDGDSDPDGDPFTPVLVDWPIGDVVLFNDGSVYYTPPMGFAGTDTFTYVANDGYQDSNLATVTITVDANNIPIADNQNVFTDEDLPVAVTLTASDGDDDTLVYSVGSGPFNGALSGTPPNLTYTPDPDYHGLDSFTFTAYDGMDVSNIATVTIDVAPVNDAPVATDLFYGAYEDMTKVVVADFGILRHIVDPDGDPLTVHLVSGPVHAQSFTLNVDGSFTYDPAPNYFGPDSFTYKLNDGTADSNTATVSINVVPGNDVPVAEGQSVATDEDTAKGITLTGSDIDGDSLTFNVATTPANGTLSGTAPNLTYTPDVDFNGSDSFTFTANDGTATSNAATVSITVNAVSDAPVANDQNVSTPEDTAKDITLTGSDADGDSLTYAVTAGPSNGSLSGTAPNLTYTPDLDFSGSDSFTFTANDGTLGSNTATVSITVNAVNDAPVADDQAVVTDEDTAVAITLSGSDIDSDPLTFTVGTGPSNGTLTGTAPNFTYTPNPDFNGSDSFTFTADDGALGSNTATVSITVNAVNDAPAVTNPGTQNNAEGDVVSLPIPASDVDGDTLAYSATGLPSGLAIDSGSGLVSGTLTYDSAGSHSIDVTVTDGQDPASVNFTWNVTDIPRMHVESIATGTYVSKGKTRYTADVLMLDDGGAPVSGADVTAHWAGTGADTTLSTLSTNASGIATFETNGIKKPSGDYVITIDDVVKSGYLYDLQGSVTSGQYPPPAQNPPAAYDDSYSVDEGAQLNVGAPGVLGNDTDAESDPLTAVLAGGPSHGVLNLNPDGSFSYTHDGSETTSDSFTYRANDGTVDSNTATVTITVRPVNDPPTAADDSASTQQDAAVLVDVLANDSDPDGDILSVSAVTQGASGSVVNNGSDVTYTPDPGYTGPDSFTYTADDGNGGTDIATVTVTIFPQNDPPTATDDSASTDEDAAVVVDVLANDSDPDSDPLTVSAVTQGSNGTVANNGTDVTYTPDPDYHGPDSFTYTAADGNGGTDTATVTVTVLSVNDIPMAADDSASTPEDTAIVIDVLANDSDADGDTLTVLSATQGANGTAVNNGGSVTYTPDPGHTGPDSFTYTADDGNGGTDTATVSVTVTLSNFPPVANAGDDQSGARRQNLTFDGSGSYDPDGTITSWSWDFGDNKTGSGEVVVHKFTKKGTFTVTLTVTDDQGAQDTDTATVTIN